MIRAIPTFTYIELSKLDTTLEGWVGTERRVWEEERWEFWCRELLWRCGRTLLGLSLWCRRDSGQLGLIYANLCCRTKQILNTAPGSSKLHPLCDAGIPRPANLMQQMKQLWLYSIMRRKSLLSWAFSSILFGVIILHHFFSWCFQAVHPKQTHKTPSR